MTAHRIVMLALMAALSLWSSAARAGEASTPCKPREIAAEESRVLIQCTGSVGGVSIFAVPTSDAANATRIFSLLSAGQLYGDALALTYDPDDTTGPSFGCDKRSCRLLLGVTLRKLP